MGNDRERLRQPNQRQLREQPQRRHGRNGTPPPSLLAQGCSESQVSSFLFHHGGHEHGENGDQDAETHLLEQRDAGFFAGDPAEGGDQDPVVEWDPDGEADHGEDGVGGGGDFEVGGAEAAVGLKGLEHHVGLLLGGGDVVDYCGCPYWDHSNQAFHFFHLLYAAQCPWVCC